MNRLIAPGVLVSFFLGGGGLVLSAQDKPMTEKQKIEALIRHVENLKDAKFIRNDTEYDAATAARFLRGKWEAQEAKIKTAREFIDQAASVSSTSGKAYRIRFKDGKEMKSGEYLSGVLKKLESRGRADPQEIRWTEPTTGVVDSNLDWGWLMWLAQTRTIAATT